MPVVELSLPTNFANKRFSLKLSQRFQNSFRALFLMTSMLLPVCCFEKSCIILKRNFGGILFQKSLTIQECCKLNIGYLPEDFHFYLPKISKTYISAILSKLILLCVHLCLKNCQSSLRRSAIFTLFCDYQKLS